MYDAPGLFLSGAYIVDNQKSSTTISPSLLSLAVTIAAGLTIFWVLFRSYLGDRFGRRWTMILSSILVIIFLFPFELLVKTGDFAWFVVGLIILNSFFKIADGVAPTLITEQFSTKYRFSGSRLAYQFGSLTLIPVIVEVSGEVSKSIDLIFLVGIIAALITLISVALLSETKVKTVE